MSFSIFGVLWGGKKNSQYKVFGDSENWVFVVKIWGLKMEVLFSGSCCCCCGGESPNLGDNMHVKEELSVVMVKRMLKFHTTGFETMHVILLHQKDWFFSSSFLFRYDSISAK